MKNTKTLWLAVLTSTLASSRAWAQASIFEAASGQPGNVVLTPGEIRVPELEGIQLLPLECMGRTRLTMLLAGETQRRTDIPAAARLLLPHEGGSLYKFSRAAADGTSTFGFFLVGANGRARSVFELAGTGPRGGTDPIPGRVAVHSGGRCFLVASSLEAGGDLFEVDLVTGSAENRSLDLAPLEIGRNGLILLDTWGLGVGTGGVVRFERTPGAQASGVAMPIASPWFGPDVVHSADGSTVAFVAGCGVDRALVFSCRRLGAALQASDLPMRIPGAGFLPEESTGPHLALSTDGSWVAWRSNGASAEAEAYVRQTGTGQRPTDHHLTGLPSFDETLNDTGVIAFYDPDSLVLLAGRNASESIGRADLFRFDLSSCGSSCTSRVENLSGTSDVTTPPYDYGYLEASDGLYQVPGPERGFLVRNTEYGRLLWVGMDGARPVLDGVSSVESIEVAGTYLVAEVKRPLGASPPLCDALSLVQIPPGGASSTVVPLPAGCRMTRTVGSRSLSLYAGVLEVPGGERLGRLPVPSPNGFAISSSLLLFGPTVGLAEGGAVLATLQRANDRTALAWSELGTQLLRTSRMESFVLPGL